ncbi:MAG: phosphoadenosine phosphosulfate reductase family protein [Minisyncoccia bacterium]
MIEKIYNLKNLPKLLDDETLKKFNESIQIMEDLYKANKKWVITYSGGKDSTTLVVLALFMKEIHPDLEINVVYSDTLIEIPQMSNVAYSFLKSLNEKYKIKIKIVYPKIEDTFWVRMIGRGYPPPGPRFRWCTDKIKIKPTKKLFNNYIYITGMRIGESLSRNSKLKDSCLVGVSSECGNSLWMKQKGIYVAAPLINWNSNEIWNFLINSAKKVIPEVEYVINLYGNTSLRFGCWMCTVVKNDKTMLILSQSGDLKIKKLLEFKNWLIEESKKEENRYFKKNGKKGRLSKKFRRTILMKLLELEKETGLKLISDAEVKLSLKYLKSKDFGKYK